MEGNGQFVYTVAQVAMDGRGAGMKHSANLGSAGVHARVTATPQI